MLLYIHIRNDTKTLHDQVIFLRLFPYMDQMVFESVLTLITAINFSAIMETEALYHTPEI